MQNTTLAIVFPGQGSQKVGMLAPLAQAHPVIRTTFDEASEVLGWDVWALAQDGPEEDLNQTENTQPALLAASVALWRAWCATTPVEPALMAGHSLGEYSALVAAGSIAFEDAVRVVRARGEYMQQSVGPGEGGMAAIIGLDDDAVRTACANAAAGDVVAPVNFNAPGQVVIAGSAAAVERASAACKEAGARRCLPLPVSVPSHCDLMRPAAERLGAVLDQIQISAPRTPVLQNVDADFAGEPAEIRARLVRQLYSPVLWVDTVKKLSAEGVTTVLECGPGKVLTGLNKRILKTLNVDALEDLDRFAMQVEELNNQ